MNLQIGTILIAKEDIFMDRETTNPWAIKENPYKIVKYRSDQDDYMIIDEEGADHYLSMDFINQHFTIKRYTLQDLKDKKIAVRLRGYNEFELVCDILNVRRLKGAFNIYLYHGIDASGIWMYLKPEELEGRTLLESIDMIDLEVTMQDVIEVTDKAIAEADLEVKEEVKETSFTWQVMEADLANAKEEIARLKGELEKSQEAGQSIAQMLNDEMKEKVALMNEIIRLKGENEALKNKINLVELTEVNTANKYSSALTEIAQLKLQLRESSQISQDQEKRERMAWEAWLKDGSLNPKEAFELADLFLNYREETSIFCKHENCNNKATCEGLCAAHCNCKS